MAATLDDVVAQLQKVNAKLSKVSKWLKKSYPDDTDLNTDDVI